MNENIKISKLAVIGTGAAGLGVLAGLLNKKYDCDIAVYDIGNEAASFFKQ